MKKFVLAAIAVGTALAAAAPAEARDHCGPGGHRDRFGYCRPNRGPVIVGPGYAAPGYVAPGFVIGRFYPGRGYWDGGRFRGFRRWDHGGWRYR